MPNGHLPVPPEIDPSDSHSAWFTWMSAAVSLVYHGLSEVKDEVVALQAFRDGVETEQVRRDERRKLLQEQKDRRDGWLRGVKLKVETIAALVGLVGGGIGLGVLIGNWL